MPIKSLAELDRCANCSVSSCDDSLRFLNESVRLVQNIGDLTYSEVDDPTSSEQVDSFLDFQEEIVSAGVQGFKDKMEHEGNPCSHDDESILMIEEAKFYFQIVEKGK